MTKIFDKQIEKVMKLKRANAIFVAEENLKLARADKIFSEIEKEEIDKRIELANLMADGVDVTKEKIKLSEINMKKEKRLKEIGLEESDIKPKYFCSKCEDKGVVETEYCDCRTAILNDLLLQKSGMSGNLEDFKDAKFDLRDSKTEKIFNLLEKWAKKFPNVTKKTIYLTGDTGVGKTFLLKCIANELIKKEVFVFYTTAFKMNSDFLEYCKVDAKEKNTVLAPYLESEVLLLDDLGTEPLLNNITLDYLYLILNERILSNKTTIINSNLSLERLLSRYGERIFSRIMNKRTGLALKIEGDDLRLKR